MRLPYGFYYNGDGHVAIDSQKANIVKMIYRQYLSGMSLGGIAGFFISMVSHLRQIRSVGRSR